MKRTILLFAFAVLLVPHSAVDVGTDGTVGIRVPAEGNVRFFRLVLP